METTYHRLGDYIRPVDVRNRDLTVTEPMGINIDKHFMPSVANVIGTDLSAYKLVSKNQFACNLMHVGRDEKIPIAMLTGDKPILVSPAYFVFEITKTESLFPAYLMMWFRRREFDRNAWFHTSGDVRGGLDKLSLLDMRLPIPSIDRQREIVAEYETLTRRICLNEQMIEKLEAVAQALYRKMFIDNIDKQHLPQGWRIGNLYELCDSIHGGDWGKDESIDNYIAEVYCVRGADIPFVSKGDTHSLPKRFILPKNLTNRRLNDGNIIVEISGGTPTQSTGRSFYVSDYFLKYISKDLICSNFCKFIVGEKGYDNYIYATLKEYYNKELMFRYENSSNGISNLDLESLLKEEQIPIPSLESLMSFTKNHKIILKQITTYGIDNSKLKELQSLLLAKMGK